VTGAIGRALRLSLEQRQENTRTSLQNATSGGLQVVAPAHYQLEDAAKAHAALENRTTTGAVVLEVDGSNLA
jgi:NADPH:quinone reductase-like Zn-dependent oxidoreductase